MAGFLGFIFYGSSGKKASLDSLQGTKTCNSQIAEKMCLGKRPQCIAGASRVSST